MSLRDSEHRGEAGVSDRVSDRAPWAGSGDVGTLPGVHTRRDCWVRIWGAPNTPFSVPGNQSLGKYTHLCSQVPRMKDICPDLACRSACQSKTVSSAWHSLLGETTSFSKMEHELNGW